MRPGKQRRNKSKNGKFPPMRVYRVQCGLISVPRSTLPVANAGTEEDEPQVTQSQGYEDSPDLFQQSQDIMAPSLAQAGDSFEDFKLAIKKARRLAGRDSETDKENEGHSAFKKPDVSTSNGQV